VSASVIAISIVWGFFIYSMVSNHVSAFSPEFNKALAAVALMGMTPSAFADVITDWNEKTVAFVTPRMVPAAGQRVVAIVQVVRA
jgi:hypothetical protein